MKLLKIFLFTFSIGSMAADYIGGLPNGHFLGSGQWANNSGNGGEYQTYVEFKDNNFYTDYLWSDGLAQVSLSFAFKDQGWFYVFHDGKEVGEGFCMSHQCRYWMNLNNETYTETITFYQDRFYKFGFKYNEKEITKWEEVFKFLENTIPSLPVVPALPIYEEPNHPTLPGSYELPVLPIFIGEPNGNYIKFLGEGNWNNNLGEFGNYQVFSNVSSYHVSSIYVWEKVNTSLEIKFNFTSNNFFEVYTSLGTVGVGFCTSSQCQYSFNIDGEVFTETLTFYANHLHKIGHRIEKGVIHRWEEVLNNIDETKPFDPILPVIPVNK